MTAAQGAPALLGLDRRPCTTSCYGSGGDGRGNCTITPACAYVHQGPSETRLDLPKVYEHGRMHAGRGRHEQHHQTPHLWLGRGKEACRLGLDTPATHTQLAQVQPPCRPGRVKDSRDPALAGGVAAEAGQLQLLHLPLVVVGQLGACGHGLVREHGHPEHQPAVALGQHGAPEDVPSAAVVIHEAPHVACAGVHIVCQAPNLPPMQHERIGTTEEASLAP